MRKIFFGSAFIFLLAVPAFSLGFSIVKNISAPVTGQFSLSPIKLEFQLNGEEFSRKNIKIFNRTGKTSEFLIETEDVFAESSEASKNNLSKYISVDNSRFVLDSGDEATVVVTAKAPVDNTQKFVSGAILVSRRDVGLANTNNSKVVMRTGALVFIDIGKIATKSGHLKDFVYNGNGAFNVSFKNTGETKLNPYGFIEVKNAFGKVVGRTAIEPWYVLPGTERTVEIRTDILSKTYPLYLAQLVLYPGYGESNKTENKSMYIYNFSASLIYIILIVLSVIILIKFLKHGKK